MNSASQKHAAAAGSSEREAIATEQDYVDGLFSRLDDEVAAANERLNEVQADVDPSTPDADALVRRETEYHGLKPSSIVSMWPKWDWSLAASTSTPQVTIPPRKA